jgi:hypothetical protein
MESIFLKKYNSKSNQELQNIIEAVQTYAPEARSAAQKTLNERAENPEIHQSETLSVSTQKSEDRTNPETITLGQLFSTFTSDFTFKDFLIPLTSAIFLILLNTAIRYISNNDNPAIELLMFTLLISNHVMYKLLHKRSNIFIGRVCIDSLFFALYFGLTNLFSLILPSIFNTSFFVEGILTIIFLLVAVILIELLITGLNKLLNYFKITLF